MIKYNSIFSRYIYEVEIFMSLLIPIVIHTANILGIFTDPFEFEGDYGPEVNPIRQQVFELVVSRVFYV